MWQAIMALAILITIVQPSNVYGQNGSGSLMDMTQMSSTTLGDFQSLDVSDDGQTIALISTSFGTLSYDRQHQSVLRQIPRVDIAMALTSDGQRIVLSNDRVSDELHLDAFFYGDIDIELLPDETQLVVTTIDGTLGLWSLTDQSWIFFEKVEAFPRLMTISDDGRWVVIAYAEKMTIWEFNEQPILKTEVPICKSPSLVRFLPNNSQLVVSTTFGHTSIWNIETAQTGLSLLGSEDACNGLIEQYPQERMLTLTSNDEWLVTGHANGNIRFWSLEDFSQIDELNFDVMGPVFNLHIDGEQLLERNGQFEDQIDPYDFALSAWSLTADHERLWHYPLNHQALLDFPPSSDLLAQGFLEGVFSIVTLESLASGTPSGVRYEIDGQVSEIEMVGKTVALVIDNEIQLWQADSE